MGRCLQKTVCHKARIVPDNSIAFPPSMAVSVVVEQPWMAMFYESFADNVPFMSGELNHYIFKVNFNVYFPQVWKKLYLTVSIVLLRK